MPLPPKLPLPPQRPATRPTWPLLLAAGLAGWLGVAWLGVRLYSDSPKRAGFDLELLLDAGRRVAAGATPYSATILAGRAPDATDLFYSYPPPVAQYLSLFAAVPSGVMLVVLGAAAALGLVLVSVALGRLAGGVPSPGLGQSFRAFGLPVAAAAPFVFPFAIAILFGNLDVLFPLLYGLMLLGALGRSLTARFSGGAALAMAAVAKLHPASMSLWFVARGLRERRQHSASRAAAGGALLTPGTWLVAAAAVAVGIVIVGLSLAASGFTPWIDYSTVLRAGAGAAIVDSRNAGPAVQVALLVGGGEGTARLPQVAVTLAAIGGTVAVAWVCEDTLESFAWATIASLVILPVTWFHYPVAVLPVAIVAWSRADAERRSRVLGALAGAIVAGVLGVALPVFVWLAVALVLVAVRQGRPMTGGVMLPAPTAGPSGSWPGVPANDP